MKKGFSPDKTSIYSFEAAEEPSKSTKELVEEFEQHEHLLMGELLSFEGVGDKDVYNITAPFEVSGRTYIAGRVEPRKTERDSQVRFFEEEDGVWVTAPDTPTFTLQDPFVAKIGKELVFGGIEAFPHPDPRYAGGLGYRTIFYRGENLQTLTRFATGLDLMKDIRLAQLPSGKIVVFTRPQGATGGRGKIGFMKLPDLDALAIANLLEAKLIKGQFRDDEWGGANELHLLADNHIGVLGNIAYEDANGKHYYAMVFSFDPETEIASPLTIIAARKNFPPSPAKRSPELDDAIFPGGLIRHQNRTATLYVGVSDTSAGRKLIPDPFLQ